MKTLTKLIIAPLMAASLAQSVSLRTFSPPPLLPLSPSPQKQQDTLLTKVSLNPPTLKAPSPPTTRKAPIEGYGIVNLQWAIPVTNNYHNNTTGAGALDTRAARAASDTVTVNGTIQNVIAHLAAHHPEYMAAVDASIAAEQEELKKRRRRAAACCHCSHVGDPPAEPKPKPTDPPAEPLPPVDPHLVRSTECNNFRDTKYDVIREGAWYLKGVRGEPVLGPGPGECARVSCTYCC